MLQQPHTSKFNVSVNTAAFLTLSDSGALYKNDDSCGLLFDNIEFNQLHIWWQFNAAIT